MNSVNQTVLQLLNDCRQSLAVIYDDREAASIASLVMESVTGLHATGLMLHADQLVTVDQKSKAGQMLERLMAHEPIQYVMGNAPFFGMQLDVNHHVLIPRPETEELIQWILEEEKQQKLSVLDIGTGSGCIAISLSAHLTEAHVTGIDKSAEALHVAGGNADRMGLDVHWHVCDILVSDPPGIPYDLVVSNPPYIHPGEAGTLAAHVVDHEPGMALFVDGSDALIFYKRMAEKRHEWLKPGGRLYVEVHSINASQVRDLFMQSGFVNVELKEDINGRPRMIRAEM
ncbi:MAG: peptide chain release factor N(5)-glutamine methyltransferase [Flavobacteriales bacterium]|nr:peptide chain release factor N(5)-glutamine methyltransferase [Flavobacteriales bacterium]